MVGALVRRCGRRQQHWKKRATLRCIAGEHLEPPARVVVQLLLCDQRSAVAIDDGWDPACSPTAPAAARSTPADGGSRGSCTSRRLRTKRAAARGSSTGFPTGVSHANDDVAFTGWVSVDGARRALAAAPGVQKHIWGTRRVEELFWLWCPRFAEDVGAHLEATAVQVRQRLVGGFATPALALVWARVAATATSRRRSRVPSAGHAFSHR